MRVSRLYSGLLTLTLVIAAHDGALAQCDRNADQHITATDALIVLQDAVARHCVGYSPCPDINEDGVITATDALLVLRMVVGVDPETPCYCIAWDERFSDPDCRGPGYPAGLYCAVHYCVECELDDQCASGVCDGCAGVCARHGSDSRPAHEEQRRETADCLAVQ